MNYLEFFSKRGRVKIPNTFFGNIGDVINTPSLLASQIDSGFNLSGDDITLFEIDQNNNIKCRIDKPYSINNDNYKANNTTFFYDFDGNILNFRQRFFEINSPLSRVISNSSGLLNVQCFRLTQLTHAILPEITESNGNGFFGQITTLKRVYLPKWKNFNVDSTNTTLLGNKINTGSGIWYFHKDMQTVDNGNPHPSILNLLGGTTFVNEARYVDNKDKPNHVTDLSVSNITPNSAQLDFTSPVINTNANDFYYVYIHYAGISYRFLYSTTHEISAFYQEITGSGQSITGLPSNTEISVQIQTVDIYHNVSGYSNKITFTTL